jgi:hypothetical protein
MAGSDRHDVLEKVLRSYEAYYDVNRENPMPPFAAEASFAIHSEGYMLIKAAKLASYDAQEYVFFAEGKTLGLHTAQMLADKVWEETLARAIPKENHKSTDGILVIVADAIDKEAASYIKKERRYQSYRHGLYGSSTLRIVARDLQEQKTWTNRHGRDLERLFRDK